jgi:hypothetical protein
MQRGGVALLSTRCSGRLCDDVQRMSRCQAGACHTQVQTQAASCIVKQACPPGMRIHWWHMLHSCECSVCRLPKTPKHRVVSHACMHACRYTEHAYIASRAQTSHCRIPPSPCMPHGAAVPNTRPPAVTVQRLNTLSLIPVPHASCECMHVDQLSCKCNCSTPSTASGIQLN